MNQEVADLLREGLALIEDEEHWTTDTYQYRYVNGEVAYCSIGALRKASGVFHREQMTLCDSSHGVYDQAVIRLANVVRSGFEHGDLAHNAVVSFNDSHTHGEVVGMFKQAIIDEETS